MMGSSPEAMSAIMLLAGSCGLPHLCPPLQQKRRLGPIHAAHNAMCSTLTQEAKRATRWPLWPLSSSLLLLLRLKSDYKQNHS